MALSTTNASLRDDIRAAYAVLQLPEGATPQAIMLQYNMLVDKATKGELPYDEPTQEEQQAKIDRLTDVSNIMKSNAAWYWADILQIHKAVQALSDTIRYGVGHDSWVAARDGRNWPTPLRRDSEGRYISNA